MRLPLHLPLLAQDPAATFVFLLCVRAVSNLASRASSAVGLSS